jgi:hypothetical protein
MPVTAPAEVKPPTEATEAENREAKAKLIARYAWRLGLTGDDLRQLPYSGTERCLTRLARAAYRASDKPADHDRNPPHSARSRTWRLVEKKLQKAAENRAAGKATPDQDLLHMRLAWLPDDADPWKQDPPPEESPCPAPAPTAGTSLTAPSSPAATSPGPSTSKGPPGSSPTSPSACAPLSLPRGWAELAALPPLETGTCLHHPDRRPVVVTPDGGRCADCPPQHAEIPTHFKPSKDQAAQDLVEYRGVADGWGITLNWTPRHCNLPLRCYCGRHP